MTAGVAVMPVISPRTGVSVGRHPILAQQLGIACVGRAACASVGSGCFHFHVRVGSGRSRRCKKHRTEREKGGGEGVSGQSDLHGNRTGEFAGFSIANMATPDAVPITLTAEKSAAMVPSTVARAIGCARRQGSEAAEQIGIVAVCRASGAGICACTFDFGGKLSLRRGGGEREKSGGAEKLGNGQCFHC